MKKVLIIVLALVVTFTAFITIENVWLNNHKDYLNFNSSSNGDLIDLTYEGVSDYYDYLDAVTQTRPQVNPIVIEAIDFSSSDGSEEVLPSYEGKDNVLLTSESGSVTWTFNVPESGLYHLLLNYYPYPGKSSVIERSLSINGIVPFEGAGNISFYRIWGSEHEITQDVNNNDIRPSQVETPAWTSAYFRDEVGYVDEPYELYFQQGENTITLDSVREPLLIDTIVLESVTDLMSYSDVLASYLANGYEEVDGVLDFLQAENSDSSTSPTLYPLNDRTSPRTVPSDPSIVKLNTIGGTNWRISGDRITWSFTVPETGLYEISMRIKQKLAAGMTVARNIYINGEIPFEEMRNFTFDYSNSWRIQTLGTTEEAYLFYFEAGTTYELAMEVSLGKYGPLIAQVQSSINALNKLYREILVYTGPEPDQYRDYQLEERIDNLVLRIETERDNLSVVRQRIIDISGSKSDKTGILDTVIIQLDEFIDKPREIHKNLLSYNTNISSLGTLVLLLSAQPLEIDYFMFHGVNVELPQSKAGTIERLWFSTRAFLSTFTTDYASLGKTTDQETDETIEVWLSIGRDQANVLRRMIDETFTPETGIAVDLKLVNGSVLLPATLAKVGPDVSMGLGNNVPVNYAMRNAVYDLSLFSDFDEVATRFKYSAMVPYEFEGGTYALPEQQIFLMMFYRTDIFEELGLEVPDTWDDVISLIPDLQKHNLEFYLPIPITEGSVMNLPPNPIFSTLFYQNDGEFYINGDKECGFNEGKGPEVFETWTRFYTDYSFPVQANFLNRFRSGQMPIGITYYNAYNTLSVFAPEIRGKWDFVPVPGTSVTDTEGNTTIRRETVSSGTGVMIMEQSEHKEASWEYLKWWTSTDTQVRFGREMEGILGAAARYPTANVEAMSQLPWTVKEYLALEEQWDWVRGIPEVPGSYMLGRYLDNAFRLVYNENSNPRETIFDYVQVINEEITKKRSEFGLD